MSKTKKTPEELSEVRREVGRKGGNTTKARHGKDYFVRIGSLGGNATKAQRENAKKSSQDTDE